MRFKVDCVLERQDDAGNKNKRTPFILSSPHNYSAWIGRPHRGDVNSIHVRSGTNIPDNFLVHVKKSKLSGNALLIQVPRWALSRAHGPRRPPWSSSRALSTPSTELGLLDAGLAVGSRGTDLTIGLS
nr:hypothetical protein BHE74_00043104 [Ipomoea trifida]